MDFKKILAGAVSGCAAAVVVDINAWTKAPADSPFSWKLAIKRWVAGAVTGAMAAIGVATVPGG